MTKPVKVVAILAVYVALVAIAWLASEFLRIGSPPADQASAGMSAFGDMVLFLGVLVVGMIPATVIAIRIWRRK